MNKLDDIDRKQECYQALAKEYCGLDDRGLWRCVKLPPGAVCHPVLVHIKCKKDPNGNFICVKGRLCVRGDKMEPGRDFGLVYAPTGQLRTARCEIAMCIAKNYHCKAIDVSQAFTFGFPDRRTFIDIPPGRKPPTWSSTAKWVMELVRNLYGVPSAPRRWHIEIHNLFLRHGFTPSPADPCLFSSKATCESCYSSTTACPRTRTPRPVSNNTKRSSHFYRKNTNCKMTA